MGKTTLSRLVGDEKYSKFSYLNWDNPEDKKKILSAQFDPSAKLLIFDEIHKYKKWKNYIKGQFDKYKDRFSILVTGSARMDLYQKGGDSLMGRYFYYRLHPFSLAETVFPELPNIEPFSELQFRENPKSFSEFEKMFIFGGFPEPFFSGNLETLRRWHNQRMDRLVKEDIRDIETVRDLSALQILAETLPSRVGSALSLNSLREDLQVAYGTIKLWADILERFYYHFRIYPFASSAIKSLRKEAKMYLWDWSQVPDEGARLENMAGAHLLKLCHYLYDAKGFKAELFYLRDIEKREVDFLVAINRKPWMAIEVKSSNQSISQNLRYFGKKLDIPFQYQLIKTAGIDFIQDNVRVMSVDKFFSGLV